MPAKLFQSMRKQNMTTKIPRRSSRLSWCGKCKKHERIAGLLCHVGIEPGVEEAIKLKWKQNLTKSDA